MSNLIFDMEGVTARACMSAMIHEEVPSVVNSFISQVGQIALTIFGTVVGGVVVYILGRFIEGAILQPLAEQRRMIAEVAIALTMYAKSLDELWACLWE